MATATALHCVESAVKDSWHMSKGAHSGCTALTVAGSEAARYSEGETRLCMTGSPFF